MMSRVPSLEGGIDGGEDCLKLRRSHLQERPIAADWRCFEPVHHMLAPVRRALTSLLWPSSWLEHPVFGDKSFDPLLVGWKHLTHSCAKV